MTRCRTTCATGSRRLSVKHQESHSSTGKPRPGYADIATSDPRDLPGAVHPIVRTHPETGRKALYLGRRFGSYIPPLPLEESEALLDALWAEATRDELAWTQSWQVGDLIVWDNRCTMHRRESFRRPRPPPHAPADDARRAPGLIPPRVSAGRRPPRGIAW